MSNRSSEVKSFHVDAGWYDSTVLDFNFGSSPSNTSLVRAQEWAASNPALALVEL